MTVRNWLLHVSCGERHECLPQSGNQLVIGERFSDLIFTEDKEFGGWHLSSIIFSTFRRFDCLCDVKFWRGCAWERDSPHIGGVP